MINISILFTIRKNHFTKVLNTYQKATFIAINQCLNQLPKTLPPGRAYVFQFPWFMKVVEEDIYNNLILDRPGVIVRDKAITVANVNITDFMPKIIEFSDRYYKTIDKIGNVEIMVER
jgi:hypothetical protein